MNQFNFLKQTVALFFAVAISFSCQKESKEITGSELVSADSEKGASKTSAINSNINVSFSRADGTYSSSAAAADFGNVSGWQDSRAYISGGWGRVTLLPNALSGAGGMVSNIDISDGSEYELDFKVRFHSQFDWSRGGKVGFGFGVGDGFAGCNPATGGTGGSMRLMWYQNDAGRVYFRPYLYYKDQPGTCGDDGGLSYPSSGSLVKGQTYQVHMYIKSNTGSNSDGRAQIKINGTTLIDRSIRWTTNDSKRLIKELWFHTFRGGSELPKWGSSQTSYIYYDDVVVRKIK